MLWCSTFYNLHAYNCLRRWRRRVYVGTNGDKYDNSHDTYMPFNIVYDVLFVTFKTSSLSEWACNQTTASPNRDTIVKETWQGWVDRWQQHQGRRVIEWIQQHTRQWCFTRWWGMSACLPDRILDKSKRVYSLSNFIRRDVVAYLRRVTINRACSVWNQGKSWALWVTRSEARKLPQWHHV